MFQLQSFLTDLSISRKLRNISRILKLQPKTIIIIGSDLTIPKELQDLLTVLQFQLPLENEISQELDRLVSSLNINSLFNINEYFFLIYLIIDFLGDI